MDYNLELLYKDSLCEIISMKNKVLSIGIVSEISPEGIIIIPKIDKLIYFNNGEKVFVKIYGIKLETVILSCIVTSSSLFELQLEELEVISHKEKRDYFRLNIQHPALVSIDDEFRSTIKAKIWDISLSGIAISVASNINPTDCHFIKFNLHDETIVLEFEIIRKINSYYSPLENKFGCRFLNLTNIQTDKLCNFIFTLQRNVLKK